MRNFYAFLCCLLLTSCGTFNIQVQMAPKATTTPQNVASTSMPAEKASIEPTSLATPTQEPTATATTIAQITPTYIDLQDGQPVTLTTIQMINSNRGWAVEATGHLVRTGDGGISWKNVTPFQASFDRHGLFVLNTDTVWAVPAHPNVNNVVWRTQDGGATWEASKALSLREGTYKPLSLQFPDAQHGWLLLLVQDESLDTRVLLYKSDDSGENWVQVKNLDSSDMQYYLPDSNSSMVFFDGQTGWLGGWWSKTKPNEWLVLTTSDGGSTWTTQALQLPGQNNLNCSGHPIADIAPGSMAVEIYCTQTNDPAFKYHRLFYVSRTGPRDWRSWKLSGTFIRVAFSEEDEGLMMIEPGKGSLNEIHRTLDNGKKWTRLTVVSWKDGQFSFLHSGVGLGLVSNGSEVALVRTEDGGLKWTQIKPIILN
jgi:photosystem II stability/assembly factor-like uncharacterized protein